MGVSEVEDKEKIEDEREAVVRVKTEKQVQKAKVPLDLSGKHPISALMELSQRKKWPEPTFMPQYNGGKFLFTVVLNGNSYTPGEGSDTKKGGKADSAKHALISLGLWPKDPA